MPETHTRHNTDTIIEWAKSKNIDVSNHFALLAELYDMRKTIDNLSSPCKNCEEDYTGPNHSVTD